MLTSVVKCSEGLSNRVSIIIIRYTDQMKFPACWLFCLSYFFMFLWFYFVSLYIQLYVLYASV